MAIIGLDYTKLINYQKRVIQNKCAYLSEPNFSQRIGITRGIKELQLNDMDSELRNSLWNAITKYILPELFVEFDNHREIKRLYVAIYERFFKIPIDTLPSYVSDARKKIKKEFFDFSWYQVYDFLEFLNVSCKKDPFVPYCNEILMQESSGYRFVGTKITPVTNVQEIREIEKAIESPLETVNIHMENALSLLSDKENPDYRNSIKESISAVECICEKISGKSNASLGDAIGTISKQGRIDLPQPLKLAFEKLYGYTSSSDGIRHALMDIPTVTQDEARFMLIICSAFVNYLISKCALVDIKLD